MAALLVSELTLEEVFVSLCDLLGSLVEASDVEVAFRRGERGWVRLGFDGKRYTRDALSVLPDDDPCGRAAREGLIRSKNPAAFALPLLIGDETVGAVAARSDALTEYDPESEALLATIAPYIAVALQQRLLLDAVARERFRAEHDVLTGLANRELFGSRLEQALTRLHRTGRSVAVLYIDLDRFKPINDTYGHEAGDEVLRQISERLKALVREVDTVARVGGDEFVILLEDVAHAEDLEVIARKAEAAISLPISYREHELQVGASIGIARAPQDGRDIETLVQRADEAMYRHKATHA